MMGQHESDTEEWKREWRDEFLHTVCAFANGHVTGRIIIGKDDQGTVVGVNDKEKKKLLETLPTKINNLMHFHPNVEAVTIKGKTCVVITVEPQKMPITHNGVHYKRSGSSSVMINGPELNEFLMEKLKLNWACLISKKTKLNDISKEAVSTFVKRGQKEGRISSAADPDDTEGILRRYELMTDEGITNAAAVLFTERPWGASYAAVTKIGLFSRESSRLLMEDIIDGPVIFQPEETMKRLTDRYVQPRFYLEDNMFRRERYQYPLKALREAILNAVVHRQYMSVQETTIRVYPDSVEIFNPGKLPYGWTAEELPGKHESRPANSLIASVFHDMGSIEKWGVGVQMIQEECEKAGIPKPVYVTNCDGVRIIFKSGPWSDTGEDIPVKIDTSGLTPLESEVYKAIAEGRYTNSGDVAISLETTDRTVRRITRRLKEIGLINRIGSDKKGVWKPTEK